MVQGRPLGIAIQPFLLVGNLGDTRRCKGWGRGAMIFPPSADELVVRPVPCAPDKNLSLFVAQTPLHDDLLSTLTLGTARKEAGQIIANWLAERDATDPTADDSEQLLAAWALIERTKRLQPSGKNVSSNMPVAPEETLPYASGRLARGLQLILKETYPDVLPEALDLLNEREQLIPPYLLPDILNKAIALQDTAPKLSDRLFQAGGQRAGWLANLNPEWSAVHPGYDFATAFQRDVTPGRRLPLLRRWRRRDPAAAREALAAVWDKQSPKNQESLLSALETGLSAEDMPWLRAGLGPKRKGVRRQLLRLLLLAGEAQATDDLLDLAASALDEQGKLPAIHPTNAGKETIVAYGGLRKNESLPEFLCSQLPPTAIPDLLGLPTAEYWPSLPKAQLKAAATAILAFAAPDSSAEFIRFALIVNPAQLPMEEAAKITAALPQPAFEAVFHEVLDREKKVLHYGGVARVLALSRTEPWSARISKAFVLQLVATLRDIRDLPYGLQRDLQSHWKLCIPLLDASIFQWSRTHLSSVAERADAFGKLATEALSVMNFRVGVGK